MASDPTTDLDALVAGLRERHVCDGRGMCRYCDCTWPCDATRAADALDTLRTLVAKARDTVRVVQTERDILLAQQKELIAKCDALRTQLAATEEARCDAMALVLNHEGHIETLTVRRLDSGYWHIRGTGPCNWTQPPVWPCDAETLRAYAHPEASEAFLHAADERARGAQGGTDG